MDPLAEQTAKKRKRVEQITPQISTPIQRITAVSSGAPSSYTSTKRVCLSQRVPLPKSRVSAPHPPTSSPLAVKLAKPKAGSSSTPAVATERSQHPNLRRGRLPAPNELRQSSPSLFARFTAPSAFFYSTLSHTLFAEKGTEAFLQLLASLPGLCIIVSWLIMARYLPAPPDYQIIVDEPEDSLNHSRASSLERNLSNASPVGRHHHESSERHTFLQGSPSDIVINPQTGQAVVAGKGKMKEVTGWLLLHNTDFRLVFAFTFMITGIGLQIINNLGNIVYGLSIHADPNADPESVRSLQSSLTALLSLANCAGRLIIGFTADKGSERGISRPFWLAPIAGSFALSQIVFLSTTDPNRLNFATILFGLSYGCLYGVLPVVTLELFGIQNFSKNFGYLGLGPAVSVQIFNLIFGRITDANAAESPDHHCHKGMQCFQSALMLNVVIATAAALLAVRLWMRNKDV